MIPNSSAASSTIGNLNGTEVAMSVDLSNLSHIMTILTDLYSNPVEAIPREYIANALDSHKMAGTKRPVEVSAPTALRQTLIIEDFGLGLSTQEIADIYGTYGASTKRETNDAAGCLGLGSKSALTYTTSFTVEAVKDGRGSTVVIFRDDNGAGSMNIVQEFDTDKPNGVKVTIPVADAAGFKDAVDKFAYYLPKGLLLVNGSVPANYEDALADGAFWRDDKTLVVKGVRQDRVVMGNVSYPISNLPVHTGSVIYFADMGEVEFVPSRDALNYTDKTKAVVKHLDGITRRLGHFVQEELDKCKPEELREKFDAIAWAAGRWHALYYRDVRLDKRLELGKSRTFVDSAEAWVRTGAVNASDKIIWFDKMVFTPKRKAQIEKYVSDNGYQGYRWIEHDKIEHPLFDTGIKVTTKILDKVDVPPIARQPKRVETPAYMWALDTVRHHKWDEKPLPPATNYDTIVWDHSYKGLKISHATMNPRVLFVSIPSGRVDKFKRLYPEAVHFSQWVTTAEKSLPVITDLEREGLTLREDWRYRWLFKFESVIKDKHLRKIMAVDHTARDLRDRVQKWQSLGKSPNLGAPYVQRRYPLLDGRLEKESVEYMNLVYKEN